MERKGVLMPFLPWPPKLRAKCSFKITPWHTFFIFVIPFIAISQLMKVNKCKIHSRVLYKCWVLCEREWNLILADLFVMIVVETWSGLAMNYLIKPGVFISANMGRRFLIGDYDFLYLGQVLLCGPFSFPVNLFCLSYATL